MSEYQYYEFRAIDRPLDQEAQDALRKLSSRAEITAHGMVNTYNYGDFRGRPEELMDRYFDAFLYVANWGTRRLALRLPKGTIDVHDAQKYCDDHGEYLTVREGKEHIVVEFESIEEGGSEWTDGSTWMPRLLPIRDQLLNGDPRALYLGWIAPIWPVVGDYNNKDRDEFARLEPPVPPGLKVLDGPLKALAEFLRADSDVLAVACEASEGKAPAPASQADLAHWVAKLRVEEVRKSLVGFLVGDRDATLRAELMTRYREAHAPKGGKPVKTGRRTVAEILAAAEVREAERERARDAKRERFLDELAPREELVWRQVDEAIGRKCHEGYSQAVALLTDLRDLAARSGSLDDFRDRIAGLRQAHRGKSAFRGQLDRAKLES